MKIHSMVDIITNSSTVIYTFPSADYKKKLAEVVDRVLQEAGSDKKFDDLFDAVDTLGEDFYDGLDDFIMDEKDLSYDSWLELSDDERQKLRDESTEVYTDGSDGNYMYKSFRLLTKSGEDTNLTSALMNIFESEESYN